MDDVDTFTCSMSDVSAVALLFSPCGTLRHVKHSHTPISSSFATPTHCSGYQDMQNEHLINTQDRLDFGLILQE